MLGLLQRSRAKRNWSSPKIGTIFQSRFSCSLNRKKQRPSPAITTSNRGAIFLSRTENRLKSDKNVVFSMFCMSMEGLQPPPTRPPGCATECFYPQQPHCAKRLQSALVFVLRWRVEFGWIILILPVTSRDGSNLGINTLFFIQIKVRGLNGLCFISQIQFGGKRRFH